MKFEDFNKLITDQITGHTTVHYGSVGTQYLKVLSIKDDKIIELGELIYRIWRETLYTEQDLINFGKECEDYRLGLRTTMPVWCYKENNQLSFYD
jgi:hypothetical protein